MSMDAPDEKRQDSDARARIPRASIPACPIFDSFENLTDPSIYTPLPPGWLIGTSRHRALDRGHRGGTIQGRQHGRGRRHRRGRQCAEG